MAIDKPKPGDSGYDSRADTHSDKWVPADLRTKPMDINVPGLQPQPGADIDSEALAAKLKAEFDAQQSGPLPPAVP